MSVNFCLLIVEANRWPVNTYVVCYQATEEATFNVVSQEGGGHRANSRLRIPIASASDPANMSLRSAKSLISIGCYPATVMVSPGNKPLCRPSHVDLPIFPAASYLKGIP